ncbi:hypothetical protein [Desmospora activa]|nr:hypothetical protein [Desmospora activa]
MNRLVGLWSVDVLYGPGAQEDTVIAFMANGEGWLAFYHYVLLERETFYWRIDDGGRLHISGKTYAGYTLDDQWEEKPSDWTVLNLSFRIAGETVPSSESMDVLTFSKPLWCNESRFGLLKKEVSRKELPQFDHD